MVKLSFSWICILIRLTCQGPEGTTSPDCPWTISPGTLAPGCPQHSQFPDITIHPTDINHTDMREKCNHLQRSCNQCFSVNTFFLNDLHLFMIFLLGCFPSFYIITKIDTVIWEIDRGEKCNPIIDVTSCWKYTFTSDQLKQTKNTLFLFLYFT